MRPLKRISTLLISIGLALLLATLTNRGIGVYESSVFLRANETRTLYFYLQERDTIIIIDVFPLNSSIDVIILDLTQYLNFIKNKPYNCIFIIKNKTSGVAPYLRIPKRDYYILVIKNVSSKDMIARIRIAQKVLEWGVLKVSCTVIILGVILFIISKIVESRRRY